MARIYNKNEINKIKTSGKILRDILEYLKEIVKEGVSTQEIDDKIFSLIKKSNSEAAFFRFNGYPSHSCISIDEEIVHGIPEKKRVLRKGNIVSIDIGVKHNNYIADSAVTYPIGNVSQDAKKLMDVTYNSLYEGIKNATVNNRIGDIGYAIQSYVEGYSYNVIKDFVGHGVGLEVHEEPQVPNYGCIGKGVRLKVGMVLAIEPMVSLGTGDVIIKDNGWTVESADKSLSAHFEHTIAITDDGPMILTI